MGLSRVERYLMTWPDPWGLGSSHQGAGENSLTKRTHMPALLRLDEEQSRRPGPAAVETFRKTRSWHPHRNLGHGNRPGNLPAVVFRGAIKSGPNASRRKMPARVWRLDERAENSGE